MVLVSDNLKVREPNLREFVYGKLDAGILWLEPLIQLNPSYESGANIADLISEGLLHSMCAQFFSRNGKLLPLYKHQERAIRNAINGRNFVLTSGTGSGKSLAYFIPIVNHVLKDYPEHGGVRAIIVYPMNALINSQLEEFSKWLGPNSAINVDRYTGQEGRDQGERLQANPPHIVLTNYSMLELMLTRPHERKLVGEDGLLRFVVLDEMHTHRGREGADVALLIRRVQERYGRKELQCFGTSATLATEGSESQRRQAIAGVATKVFGSEVTAEYIIEESLVPAHPKPSHWSAQDLSNAVGNILEEKTGASDMDNIFAWIEHRIGLQDEGNHYRRANPKTLSEASKALAMDSGCSEDRCQEALKRILLSPQTEPEVIQPPFKLRQFISQGGTVYGTLQPPADQARSIVGALNISENDSRLLFPMVFCRECGQEYYMCTHNIADRVVTPRAPEAGYEIGEETTNGYILLDHEGIWSKLKTCRTTGLKKGQQVDDLKRIMNPTSRSA